MRPNLTEPFGITNDHKNLKNDIIHKFEHLC